MSKHKDFILTDIDYLLEDAVRDSQGISKGISSFAISEYIFQSLFLRMTGFLEQKAKCICWEMATENYEYRRKYLENATSLGEMSCKDSKKHVYKSLLDVIRVKHSSYEPGVELNKDEILQSINNTITDLFDRSLLRNCNNRHYDEFKDGFNKIYTKESFVDGDEFLKGKIVETYESLYNCRNRLAHNTRSYQQNLPSLNVIADRHYEYENYYIRYATLLLIDRVYIRLFEKFCSLYMN